MKHIRILIERGFLPVSTDYRLCPEKNLFDGPMTDCCDALKWVTETLTTLSLSGPAVRPDPDKVVVFGWSSGGQLAMSLGYTANNRGIKGPDAIFALYPPSDMESDREFATLRSFRSQLTPKKTGTGRAILVLRKKSLLRL